MADYIKHVEVNKKIYDVYDETALHSLPDNAVTTDGAQTITGDKTFTSDVKVGSSSIGTNGYIEGTRLKITAASDSKGNFATINDGWIYYRTPKEVAQDIGVAPVEWGKISDIK